MSTLALFASEQSNQVDSTDAQNTPRDLALDLGRFELDVASNPRSHIQADRSLCLEYGDDGLTHDWRAPSGSPASVWCNGPYSDPLPWCRRLREHRGAWCCLWKLDTTTTWFAVLMDCCDAWGAFRKRLRFERDGNCGVANFSSVLVWGGGWELPDAVRLRLWPIAKGI